MDQPQLTAKISQVFIHPNYTGKKDIHKFYWNDIALVKLGRKVKFSKWISAAHLITQHDHHNFLDPLYATGWGRDLPKLPIHHRLQYVKLREIAAKYCKDIYKDVVNKKELCVKAYEKSLCSGDSGGPIVAHHKGLDYVIGVISFGETSCAGCYPVIATRVASYANWIRDVIDSN